MSESVIDVGFPEFIQQHAKTLVDTKAQWLKTKDVRLIKTIQELSEYVDKAIERGYCVIDIETTGISTRTKKVDGKSVPVNKIVGFCLSYHASGGCYIPTHHQVDPHLNLPEKEVFREIARLAGSCVTIFHNAKFDLNVLRIHGIIIDQFDRFEDTLILARLHEASRKEIGLKHLSETLLNQPMLTLDDICPDKTKRLDMISPDVAYLYGASDAICTLQLYEYFICQQIIKEQQSIYNLEKRTTIVVIEMESNLILVDVPYIKELKTRIEERMDEVTSEIYRIVGQEFNIGSPKVLGDLLFNKLGYRYPDKMKTASGQFKTDNATFEKIQDEYPVVKYLMEYRALDKTKGTYVEKLLLNHDEDGCIKLSFNQTGTDTGRFSSPGGKGIEHDGYCGVNVQSMPAVDSDGIPDLLKKYPLRRAFKARPGYQIVAMDYAGEELRVTTNYCREPKWLDEFENGSGDLHTKSGQAIFRKKEISKPERKIAKTANFLIIYGGGPHALSVQAKIGIMEARRILRAFFEGLPTLKKWIEKERVRARKNNCARTAFGRVRPLGVFYNSGDKAAEAHGDRCAVNFLIQGTSADIMKTAMVRIRNWVVSNGLQDDIRMLITVHDEVVFEIKKDKLHEYIPQLYDIMKLQDILQGILKWPVGLTVDAEYGDTWAITGDFFKENPEAEKTNGVKFYRGQMIGKDPGSENPEPESPRPENPEPGSPDPESPEPENPEPGSPKPENPETENPEPGSPDPESPKPENPEPGSPKPESLNPENPEPGSPDPENPETEDDQGFVYILHDLKGSTCRVLNTILLFLNEDQKTKKYRGPFRTLTIKDKGGHILNVSEFKISVDAFLGLARYFGI